MKCFLTLLLLASATQMAVAQTGMLAGKVVDAGGHPMAKVKVSLKQHDKDIIQKTNKEGHYYIDQLTKGNYTVTISPSKKEVFTAKNINIEPNGLNHTYYTFVLSDNGMKVIADKHDPFVAEKLRDKKSPDNLENIDGDHIIIINTMKGEIDEATSVTPPALDR